MIRIAICDDEAVQLEMLSQVLERYRAERCAEVEYTAFQSPLDLLHKLEQNKMEYDVILMDILMPGENGMEAAEEIRKLDRNVKIIFLTSTAEYAVDSYRVQALYYLLKPVDVALLYPLLDGVAEAKEKECSSTVLLRCKDGLWRVELSRVEYCEVLHRTLLIRLTDGQVLESVGTMAELQEQLGNSDRFLRPHRSFLVQVARIRSVSYRAIVMESGAEIPIPRGKYREIKDAFLEMAFDGRGEKDG